MMQAKDLSTLLSPVSPSKEDWEAIERIRRKQKELNIPSKTSEIYSNDICEACFKALSSYSGPIVEIGVYRGALTCLLAYFAKKFNRTFVIVDINAKFINKTKEALSQLDLLGDKFQFVTGTIIDFFEQTDLRHGPPSLIVVDADHTFSGARLDLCAILSNVPDVPAIVFHDYDLVMDHKMLVANPDFVQDINDVKSAILNVLGDESALHPVGRIGDETEIRSSRYAYLKSGGLEGVILFPKLLDRMAFIMAQSSFAVHTARKHDAQKYQMSNQEAQCPTHKNSPQA